MTQRGRRVKSRGRPLLIRVQLKAGAAGVRVSCSDRISEAEPQLPTADLLCQEPLKHAVYGYCGGVVPPASAAAKFLHSARRDAAWFLTQQSHHNDSSVILCIPSLRLVAPLLL